MSQTIARIVLACGVEGCEHGPEPEGKGITFVRHPGAVTTNDVRIFNRNRWQRPRLTAVEKKRLQYLLNSTPVCPIHDRQKLGYQVTYKITESVRFVIE